ncbi:hypothetical protein IWQ61_008794, partial [Dispira simplex]
MVEEVNATEIYEWWKNHPPPLESLIEKLKELENIADSLFKKAQQIRELSKQLFMELSEEQENLPDERK